DRGLLPGDVGDRRSEALGVVEVDVRDRGDAAVPGVGRVEAPAKADLHEREIDPLLRDPREDHGGQQLELRRLAEPAWQPVRGRDRVVDEPRERRRVDGPTEFELLTAVVFAWFAEERIDLALVEVGLGGRLDATHAWDGGVAAVTNVDLDHTERLGPTIAHIAREKAAIIERGDLAVTGATGEALAIVRRRAARLGVPLAVAAPPAIVGMDRDGLIVDLPRLGQTRVGLRGRHQAANVAVADGIL